MAHEHISKVCFLEEIFSCFPQKSLTNCFFYYYLYNIIPIPNYPGPASPVSRVPVWPQESALSQTASICGHKGTRTKGEDGFKCEKLS